MVTTMTLEMLIVMVMAMLKYVSVHSDGHCDGDGSVNARGDGGGDNTT